MVERGECPVITHGESLTDRKSTFQAHAAVVSSKEEVGHSMCVCVCVCVCVCMCMCTCGACMCVCVRLCSLIINDTSKMQLLCNDAGDQQCRAIYQSFVPFAHLDPTAH